MTVKTDRGIVGRAPARKRRLSLSARKALAGLAFVSPFVVGFVAFYLRGLLLTLDFSLSDLSLRPNGGYDLAFVGLKHYIYAFREHATFKQILTSSVGDMALDVPLILFFSLFMAILLNQRFRGRTFARAVFFLPVLLNAPAIADALELSRAMMLGGTSPASAAVTQAAGDASVNMSYYVGMMGDLGLPRAALDYVVGAVGRINGIITSSGVQLVIFLAALQSISPALYEVAKIEGATAYESFWKITFPMVSPLIVTNMVYTLVDSFVSSDVINLSFDTIFGTTKQYGLGSAFSLVSMAALCGILMIASGLVSRRAFYQN
ncbi:MAG: sugar ABC transporter permease [Oscillospiraceae bacterium]|jgi:ABC-type sugar transport system permease subunit|nr:sugar ABC transporter permease [Oscillospiraceae bacterium]